ncbi:ADP-ribosylglycohydrolase [Linnemannia elongata AG-77]|uniref:ADP-ribosylglycohydrolase n=1 Tax=Linnemannia elongata AG-77 TaxID=1314771 RepID=A0A197JLK0_9FUNG|nr:ADP-ribosylglycohydrolase [Linnemannia elongata AG-77]
MSTPLSTLTKDQLHDRIHGVLYGNAVGDAYGLATEFMTKKNARYLYGNGPIAFGNEPGHPFWEDNHRSKWDRNDFTDDTDQLLLILQSLEQTRDGRLHATNFAKRLKEWSVIGFPELGTPPRGIGYTVGSTLTHPDFRFNPHRAAFDIWNSRGRSLAANGAVMRTSVLGIESFWDEHRVVENSLAAAKVTHADPRSIISALVASVLISRLLRGGGQDAAQDAKRVWNPKLTEDEYKESLLDYLRRGTDLKGDKSGEPEYEEETEISTFKNKNSKPIRRTLPQQQQQQQANKGIWERIKEFAVGSDEPVVEQRNKEPSPVQLRDDIGWIGVDAVGEDDAMGRLARSVVNDYLFMILHTDVVPSTVKIGHYLHQDQDPATNPPAPATSIQEKWAQELQEHCFPKDLDHLELGDGAKMGYTFKCVGVGFYAATRKVDPSPTDKAYDGPSGLFRGVMEQVTLEAGDADTNGAVVGSLLGARFGLEKGLPENWWTELRHREWLDPTIEQFTSRVLSMYDAAAEKEK